MKHVELTSEWLGNWHPRKREEVADRRVSGLAVRGGPSGAKVFYRYVQEHDATGKPRRKRVKLGRWSEEGGGGTLTLTAAREAFLATQATKRAEVDGTARTTVAEIADSYRRAILSHREHADAAWNVIRVHIVEAQPDPKRPPFGKWPAREVRPRDVAAVVEHAKERRKVEATTKRGKATKRRRGGVGVARVVLRDLKSIFGHAVETGALDASPAAVARSRSFGIRATSRARVLSEPEVGALFEALDLTAMLEGTAKSQRISETVRLGIAFLLYTPVRSHSLIGAEWREFDLDAARWTIPPKRLKLTKEARENAPAFEVPLCPTAVAILRKLKALAGDSPFVLASPTPPGPDGKPQHLTDKALVRALGRLQSGARVRLALGSRLVIHDARRSWRSWAQNLGVPYDVAEVSMGHKSIAQALGFSSAADIYTRGAMVERRAEAAALVGAALDRIRLGKEATVVPLASMKGA